MNRSGSESVRVHWEQVSDIVAFWLCCVISTVIQKIQQPVMFSDFFLMPENDSMTVLTKYLKTEKWENLHMQNEFKQNQQ